MVHPVRADLDSERLLSVGDSFLGFSGWMVSPWRHHRFLTELPFFPPRPFPAAVPGGADTLLIALLKPHFAQQFLKEHRISEDFMGAKVSTGAVDFKVRAFSKVGFLACALSKRSRSGNIEIPDGFDATAGEVDEARVLSRGRTKVEAADEAGGMAITIHDEDVQNPNRFDAAAAKVGVSREGSGGVFKISAVSEAGAVSVGIASGEVEEWREMADSGSRHVAVVGNFERID